MSQLPPLDPAVAVERYREEVAAGQRAEALVDHALFREVVDEYSEMLHGVWQDSPFGDTAARETAYHQVRALAEIEARLRSRVNTGKLAAETLNLMEAQKRDGGDGPG